MTSNSDSDALDRDHDQVRSAYRAAAFDDEPPPAVDAAILKAAQRARERTLHSYLPPLAMAATVVLALGLVLRLATPTREPPSPAALGERDVAPRVIELQAPASEEARSRAEVAQEPAPPGRASLADEATPTPAGAVPATALEEVAVTARSVMPAAASSAGNASVATDAIVASTRCAAELSDDPDDWLTCIEALVDAGEIAAAREELAAFGASYPERVVPDTIADRVLP